MRDVGPAGLTLVASGWWLVVGAAFGIGVIGILTIGIFFFAAGAVLALVGLASPRLRTPAVGLLVAGLASGPLTIAWLNREGPGMICEPLGSGTFCAEQWSPLPFLAVAAALIAGGVAFALVGDRLRRAARA